MTTRITVSITEEHVSKVMGIPSNGVNIVMHNKSDTSNCTYTLTLLKQNLHNLPVGDEFRKTFIIFSYTTNLTSNSKLKGIHNLWDNNVGI